MSDPRLAALTQWAKRRLGDVDLSVTPASVDASFRRYFRVRHGDATHIVMDAPPAQEDTGAFVCVANLLASAGVNAPRILAADRERGFILMSDLGSTQFLAALHAGADPDPLYHEAIDTLIAMQAAGERFDWQVPPYDVALLEREMALFTDWLVGRHLALRLPSGAFRHVADVLVDNALSQPQVFVHRDYHSRNLMVCQGAGPGVLDFQDAVRGPVSYDLVSLLRDCYVAWPDDRVEAWVDRYRQRAIAADLDVGADALSFRRWFDLTGIQRHLKAAGIFARLNHRDGKPGYLADIPRTLGYIVAVGARHHETTWLADYVRHSVLPAMLSSPGT